MTQPRTVFCVSDHTGLTSEAFAHSLISRFEDVSAAYLVRPFVDTPEKAAAVVSEIDEAAASQARPIVFCTFSDPDLQEVLQRSEGLVVGLFDYWVDRISTELGLAPSSRVSHYHGVGDATRYQLRLDAVDFSLTTDDGLGADQYGRADIILIGVSRVGKTPTCLYMSMHYGIRAANYPISVEEHPAPSLPESLEPYRDRLYGLTIEPRRLHAIRTVRRPDSLYASLEACRRDLAHAERIFRAEGIPHLDTTTRSIEEITATVLEEAPLTRRV